MDARHRLAAAGLALAGYAVAGHVAMSRWPDSPWSLALLVGPLAAVALAALWRAGQRAAAVALAACAGALAVVVVRGGGAAAQHVYVAQHAGIHAALAVAFGASLRGPGDALITRLARSVHPLSAAMEAYSRRTTLAWTAYFAAMAALSLALYAAAPFETWSLFANVATPLALAAMFVGEHRLRYALHPEFERVRLRDAWQAWSRRGAAPRASR